MAIKDSELQAVLAAVEQDLSEAYNASKATLLAKADEGKEESSPAESSDSDPVASPSPSPDAGSAPPAAESAPASPPAAPDASASAAPADPAAEAGPLTPEALQAEYSQLPPEELDMHIQAALAAKEALGAAGPGAASPGAAPASPGPASPPPASPVPDASAAPAGAPPAPMPEDGKGLPPMAQKAEMAPAGTPGSHGKANGGQMKKSEADQAVEAAVAAVTAKFEAVVKSQAEDIENLTKSIKMVLERPERKAVTGMSQIQYLKKSEDTAPAEAPKTFTHDEARAKLNGLIPSLSKSERDLVVGYFEKRVKLSDLEPILAKATK